MSGFIIALSKTSLLRCLLEVYTYRLIIDAEKLIKDFELPDDTLINKAVLLFADCAAYKEYRNDSATVNAKKLMEAFGIELFVFDGDSNNIIIEKS